jgi:hypothetical protein
MSTGCARQGDQTAWRILVAGGEQGTVSTGVGGHGRTTLGSDSGDGHWAGRWARQDFGQVGRFQGGSRIRPMAILENKKPFFISKSFIICKPIRIQIKYK